MAFYCKACDTTVPERCYHAPADKKPDLAFRPDAFEIAMAPLKAPAAPLSASISIVDIPEAVANLRREMAELLRQAALDEAPAVARRLHEIADLFETGLSEG